MLCTFLNLGFPESLRCPRMERRCTHPQVVPSLPILPAPERMKHAETGDVAHVGLAASWVPLRRLGNEPGHRRHPASCDPPASGASLGCSRRTSGRGRGALQPRDPPSTQRPDASSPLTCSRGCAGRFGLGRARTRAPGLLGSHSSPATSQLARASRAGGGAGL